MTEKSQLQVRLKDGGSSLSISKTCSGLIVRGRQDVAKLVGFEKAESPWEKKRRLAEKGTPTAQFDLGWAYFIGEGVPEDEVAAYHWFRKAAEQGYAPAQVELGNMYGRMYLEDWGWVVQDDAEAIRWFRKAANQGCTEAQRELKEALQGELQYDSLQTGLPRDAIGPLVKIGVNFMMRGIISLERWNGAMIAKFGSNLQPFLDMLYAEALDMHEVEQARVYAKVNGPIAGDAESPVAVEEKADDLVTEDRRKAALEHLDLAIKTGAVKIHPRWQGKDE